MMHLDDRDRFALYSLPNDTDHYLLLQQDRLHDPNATRGFVVKPFLENDTITGGIIRADRMEKNPIISIRIRTKLNRYVSSKIEYLKQVEKLKTEMRQQDIKKVVFSRIQRQIADFDLIFDYFVRAKYDYPDAFVFLFNIPGQGCWFGATPELLLYSKGGKAHTMALAGTRKAGTTGDWDSKNQKEHAEVSDYIAGILRDQACSYRRSPPSILKAGAVEHLYTSFFDIRLSSGAINLCTHLHPTPAVCGNPKQKALQMICTLEAHQRRFYTGYLGPLGLHDFDAFFVNLRSMEIGYQVAYLYLGGGIMEDSIGLLEWEETELKAQTLLRLLDT